MKSRYDNTMGKEAMNAKARQNRLESEHMATNQFVKKAQAEQAKHAGKAPMLSRESMHMGPYMCNNGEHAQDLAVELTKGLDKSAFPVK